MYLKIFKFKMSMKIKVPILKLNPIIIKTVIYSEYFSKQEKLVTVVKLAQINC